jgi:hypothetical protein
MPPYFAGAHDLLRALLAVPPDIESAFVERFFGGVYDSAEQMAPAFYAVHVRRGDYVGGGHELPLEYFEKALELMAKKIAPEKEPVNGACGADRCREASPVSVLIFSDDLEWVQQQGVFFDLPGAVFVEEADTLMAFYFLVLAAEGGIICSNSTFCWWAAFLSAARRAASGARPAILPNHWTRNMSLSGMFGDKDCGKVLFLPYMTAISGLS